ncbi:SURF1 family protein [Kineococcus rhizosphaerae]|uniref:SURF1-like protein n=1 Tax=Kineococcus rhizosphaerae TaxID=559628 RepID=A0A2T0RA40_9ACTN|nr:SURF1 family protein [Kineococcus rhizosphaerae]PRY18029.1 cytochrome oxidase assembly protein ShyY1 [Kineococcus rhizosphaerae]
MNVLRLLREPRWLRGLAVAILIALVCCLLGRWQWHRREERLAANAPLVRNYDAAPVDVTSVLPAGTQLSPARVWTPVRVSGRYDADATVLVRNRPRDEQFGYEVLVPLVLSDGTALLVDRGWLPAGSDSDQPDTVPAPPSGEVTVTARLRRWESDKRGSVPGGQVASIARDSVTRAVADGSPASGAPRLLDGYALLATETPAPADAPAAAVRPDVDEGPHLAYTVQWFGFALTALVVWVVAGRRELAARAEGSEGSAEPGPVGAGGADESGTRSTGPVGNGRESARESPEQARRRRREGLDEAAEDAELDAVDRL